MNVEFALRAVRQILNIFDLDLWLQSHIGDQIFVEIYTSQATIVLNMNTLSQNIEEEFVLRAISQIDSKYIWLWSSIPRSHQWSDLRPCCYSLRLIANYCAKYEHPRACTILCKFSFY